MTNEQINWKILEKASLVRPDLERIYPPEYYRTLTIGCDIDMSWLDAQKDTPESVTRKVNIWNTYFLPRLQRKSGIKIDLIWITQRNDQVFFDEETAPLYSPLLNINNRLGLVLCEFGTVSLVKMRNHWSSETNAALSEQELLLLSDFQFLLHKNGFISFNGKADINFPYRLEPGNRTYLALQNPNGSSMDIERKIKLRQEIMQMLQKEKREDILIFLDLSMNAISRADVDCVPKRIKRLAKLFGVKEIIKQSHQFLGEFWFGPQNMLIVDDKVHAAGEAARFILTNGGLAVTPMNADTALKQIVAEIGAGGQNSEFPVYLGTLAGIWQTVSKESMPRKISQHIIKSLNR